MRILLTSAIVLILAQENLLAFDGSTLSLFVGTKAHSVEVKNKSSSKTLTYIPSNASEVGLAYSVGIFDFALANRSIDNPDEKPYKGTTDYQDYRVGIALWGTFLELYLQSFDKLYLEDQTIAKNEYDTNNRVSAIATRNLGFQFYIPLRRDFEYKYLRGEVKEEVKNDGGSFLVYLLYNDFKIAAESYVIPQSEWASFQDLNYMTGAKDRMYGAGGGYGHIWSGKYLYASLSFLVGFAYQEQTVYVLDQSFSGNSLGSNLTAVFSLGGYSQNFFYGITTHVLNNTYSLGKIDVTSSSQMGRFFIGMKF